MDTLFLQLSYHDSACGVMQAWLHREGQLQTLASSSLSELASTYAGTPTVVFLSSTLFLLTPVTVNAKQLKQLGASLNWLIEDLTGEDADRLHVVAVEDASTTNNQVYIAAIERNLLNDFLHSLQQQKLKPLSVLPDIILLPREGSSWQLSAWPDNQLALRTGLLSGAVLEKNTFNLLLNSALQELKQDESFSIAVSENADIQHQLQSWLDQKNIQTQLVSLPAVNTVLTEKTDWLRHPANMLQGKFSASSSFTVPKIWRIAAAFVAVAFAVQLIAEGVQFGYYRYHARKSQADAVAQYKKLFPDDRRVVNLERQLKSRLEGSNQGGNVLSTLTQVAESLKASGLNAQRIDYTGRTLMLDVQGQAVGELDRLQSQLTTQGFNAEVVSANTQGAVVRGRIKVEG